MQSAEAAGTAACDTRVQFERAKAYLMKADKDGVSVYDQLTRLMESVLDDDDNDHTRAAAGGGGGGNGVDDGGHGALTQHVERFDQILQQLRTHMFVVGEVTASCAEPPSTPPDVLASLGRNRPLFERPAPQVRTTIEQPNPFTTITTTTITPPVAPTYASVTEQNVYWTAAGFGMRDEDAFLLDRSITRLAMAKMLRDVRFVGKLFGRRGDYYVVSTRRYVPPDGATVYVEAPVAAGGGGGARRRRRAIRTPPVVPAEPAYVGCNRLSFWVTTHPAAAWTLLPDVTPQQVVAARAIRRHLTGDLNARVVASPPFAWNEAVLLRAQLSRIVSATYVAPRGALEEVEQNDDDDDDDDDGDGGGGGDGDEGGAGRRKEAVYRALTTPSSAFAAEPVDVATFAQQLSMWVHAEPQIRRSGRQTRVPRLPPRDDDDDGGGGGDDEDEHRDGSDADDDDDDDAADDNEDGEGDEAEKDDDDDEAAQRDGDDDDDEDDGGEAKELLSPISGDNLYAVVDVPQPPPPPVDDDDADDDDNEDDGDDVDDAQRQQQQQQQQQQRAAAAVADNNPVKPLRDEDVADDDVLRSKTAAWVLRLVNREASPAYAMAVVRSLRWPGAMAYLADGGRQWGCVYFGDGVQRGGACYTPPAAPRVQREAADLIEAVDPTAAVEKLVRRGEEVPEADSEDDAADELDG